MDKNVFHIHLVSDATGETLIAISRAASAQYASMRAVEHVHSFVNTQQRIDEILLEIHNSPGVVLYTLINTDMRLCIENACNEIGIPHACVLDPVLGVFRSYLGAETTPIVGGQHVLDSEYFKRIDAMNFTMMHDDGQNVDDLSMADIVLIGISRTSKTPTGIYLANRGFKVANVPIVFGSSLSDSVNCLNGPLIVGMVAGVNCILQIRRNRLEFLRTDVNTNYVDRHFIARELIFTRELCELHGWPLIDVTRRSIEETAASIISFYRDHHRKV